MSTDDEESMAQFLTRMEAMLRDPEKPQYTRADVARWIRIVIFEGSDDSSADVEDPIDDDAFDKRISRCMHRLNVDRDPLCLWE